MLESSHLKVSDYVVQRWKNGGGTTHQIAIDAADPFRWRLSWAALPTSGPFSTYPGFLRTLVLLDGGPVTLAHKGRSVREAGVLVPYTFRGEWETEARVASRAENFNLLTRAGAARGGVYPTLLAPREEAQFPIAGQEHFIFCVEGKIEILEPGSNRTFVLEKRETLRVTRSTKDEYLNLRAGGMETRSACLWIVLHLK